MIKRILLVALALLVLIQFFRPARNISAGPQPQDITQKFPTPPEVKRDLQAACYDCHSNNTRYPWYASVQPFAWFIARHVDEGKGELNFSEFGDYSPKRAVRKLRKALEEIEEGGMPLASYKLMHDEARLSEAQVKRINEWAEHIIASYGQ